MRKVNIEKRDGRKIYSVDTDLPKEKVEKILNEKMEQHKQKLPVEQLEAEEEYPILDSPLGRMLFALGVEVVNCGVAKDEDRLRKVHDVYNSLQALWPANVKEIHDTVHKRMAEEGLMATETGEVVKVEKTGEPVKIQKVVKKKDLEKK